MGNPYLPYPVRIDRITTETEDKNLKTFRFVFLNPEDEEEIRIHAGTVCGTVHCRKGGDPHRHRVFTY